MLRSAILNWQWQRAIKRCTSNSSSALTPPDDALSRHLAQLHSLPSSKLEHTDFLALDLEMDGLDAKANRILSIGWVEINDLKIELESAQHLVVHNQGLDLSSTAPIHNIFAEHLDQGVPLLTAFDALLTALSSRVAVLHHAPLDLSFLKQASLQLYSRPLPMYFLDTMTLEQQILAKREQSNLPVNLSACRQRYGLPNHAAHNATLDAIATAELLLAQIANTRAEKTPIRDKLRVYAV